MISITSYITGFITSVILTLIPVGLFHWHAATHHGFPSHEQMASAFIVVAIIQLIVQLVFFLHVGKKSTESNLLVLGFATFVIIVLVGGSLWIMSNVQHGMNMEQEMYMGTPSPETEL